MNKQVKLTLKAECTDCGGTGLYVGHTCHDGAAMICRTCTGTGCVEISYIPFSSRKKPPEGTNRVYQSISYHHIYPEKHEFTDGVTIDFSQYGCTLEEWENGVTPKPLP